MLLYSAPFDKVRQKLQQILRPNPKKARPTLQKGASAQSGNKNLEDPRPSARQEVWESEDSEPEVESIACVPSCGMAVEKPTPDLASCLHACHICIHAWHIRVSMEVCVL